MEDPAHQRRNSEYTEFKQPEFNDSIATAPISKPKTAIKSPQILPRAERQPSLIRENRR
jgi:hypothetical protein